MAATESIKVEVLPDDYNQYDLSFKMIIIGDEGVGKSCLTSKAGKGVLMKHILLQLVLNF